MSTSLKNLHADNLTIGALATEVGVNVETIRFYQRKGLLSEPEKPIGGIRRYGAAHKKASIAIVTFLWLL